MYFFHCKKKLYWQIDVVWGELSYLFCYWKITHHTNRLLIILVLFSGPVLLHVILNNCIILIEFLTFSRKGKKNVCSEPHVRLLNDQRLFKTKQMASVVHLAVLLSSSSFTLWTWDVRSVLVLPCALIIWPNERITIPYDVHSGYCG